MRPTGLHTHAPALAWRPGAATGVQGPAARPLTPLPAAAAAPAAPLPQAPPCFPTGRQLLLIHSRFTASTEAMAGEDFRQWVLQNKLKAICERLAGSGCVAARCPPN